MEEVGLNLEETLQKGLTAEAKLVRVDKVGEDTDENAEEGGSNNFGVGITQRKSVVSEGRREIR